MPDTALAGSTESGSSSSPSSTADIAASVIADLDSSASGSDDTTPASASQQTTPDPQTTAADPDDFDAVPEKIKDSLNRERVNSIPHPRVKQMIARKERAIITQVAKALGITKAEAELTIDDLLGGVNERGTRITDFEGRLQKISAVEEIMLNDPDRFMQILPTLNPAYSRYQKLAEAAAAARAEDEDPEPQPDYDLGDGRRTYSLDGLKKRDEWKERQILKRLEGTINERLSPIEQERQQREQAEQYHQQRAQFAQRLMQRVERARKWPQFKENEDAIMAALKADKSLELEDAYHQVVLPKLATDRTKIRQEVLTEINSQPKSSSVTSTGSAPRDDAPKTTADIARQVMRELEG